MAIFGGDWIDDYDSIKEYENNHYIDESYDSMKRYESGMKPFRDNNEYDSMEEYEHGIKHFQD